MMTHEITFKVRDINGDGYSRSCRASPNATIKDLLELAEDVCDVDMNDLFLIEVREFKKNQRVKESDDGYYRNRYNFI